MQSIAHGISLLGQGRLAEAEAIYRSVLAREPGHFDALHMLGMIRCQQGRLDEAHELIAQAVKLKPRSVQTLSVLMAILLGLNRAQEALATSDRIITLNPGDLDALFNRAIVLARLKRFNEALALYDRILGRKPDFIDAIFERGNVLAELSRFAEAVESYGSVLARQPAHFGALTNRGNAFMALGRHADALAWYDEVLARTPGDVTALSNRAIALKEMGRHEEALASCQQALSHQPNAVLALVARGNVLLKLLRHEEALASYDRVLAIAPGTVEALSNRGLALTQLQSIGEALSSFERALALDPGHVVTIDNRGVALLAAGRTAEALADFDRALALAPQRPETLYHRGRALARLGRYEEAILAWEHLLAANPNHQDALGALAFYQLMICNWRETERLGAKLRHAIKGDGAAFAPFTLLAYSIPPADILGCARHYAHRHIPKVTPMPAVPRHRPHQKLRVAYLTSAFQRHPTAWQIVELFELHDRKRFEVLGISYGPDDGSDIRARLIKGFDQFHDVASRSDREVAQLLREREVDIAVDLKGFTEQARPAILASRPAPIQASYLGYTATMGVDFIDYILADGIVLPPEQQAHYAENIVRLPDSYWPNDCKRQVAAETPSRATLALPQNGFVFCCFNNSYKITRDVFDRWMRLLHRFEGSVLWLLQTSEIATRNLGNEARSRGIDPQRLVFAPKMENPRHLARQRAADLFLDNLPVNAHTGASDALWVGLPVLTCAGDAFIGRVAASLLHAVGLPELVARDLDEYESLACKLASDREYLASIRRKIEHNRAAFPLFQTERLCRHIERAYETMWEIFQSGEAPRSFSIER